MSPAPYLTPTRFGGGLDKSPGANRSALRRLVNHHPGAHVTIPAGTWDVSCDVDGGCVDLETSGVTLEMIGELRLVHPLASRKAPAYVLRVCAPDVKLITPQIDGNRAETPNNGIACTQSLIAIREPASGPDAINCSIEGGALRNAVGSAVVGGRSGLSITGLRIDGCGEHGIHVSRHKIDDVLTRISLDGVKVRRIGLNGSSSSCIKLRGVHGASIQGGTLDATKPETATTDDVGVSLVQCESVTLESITIQRVVFGVSLRQSSTVGLLGLRVFADRTSGGALVYVPSRWSCKRVRTSRCHTVARSWLLDNRDNYQSGACSYELRAA